MDKLIGKFDQSINSLSKHYSSLFILFLIISGNYTGKLLGCRIQEIFTKSYFVKHLVAFISLYYFVNMTSTEIHPTETIKTCLLVYLFFIISRNVTLGWMSVILLLTISIKIISDYINYFKEKKDNQKYKVTLNRLEFTRKITIFAISLFYVIGFLRYMTQKMNEHGSFFSWASFLFYSKECDNLSKATVLKNIKWF